MSSTAAPFAPSAARAATLTARLTAAFRLGALLGVAATLALGFASLLRALGDARIAISSLTALLLVATLPLFVRRARRASREHPGLLLGLSAFALAPAIVLGAWTALEDPIVTHHVRCGCGSLGLIALAPVAFVLVGMIGAGLSFAVVARAGRGVELAVRLAATLTLLASVGLAVFASASGAMLPGPDAFVDSLPVVARFAPRPAGRTQTETVALGSGLRIERECDGLRGCALRFVLEGGAMAFMRVDEDALLVRADGQDVFVVEQVEHTLRPVGAFRARDASIGEMVPGPMLFARLSPPRAWILGAWAGLAIAAIVLITGARRRSRLMLRRALWQPGTLGDDGWIHFDDGTPPRRAPSSAMSAGPVVVVPLGAAPGPATFRTDGGAVELEAHPGTVAELEARERAGSVGRYALALATVGLTSAPLVACVLAALGGAR